MSSSGKKKQNTASGRGGSRAGRFFLRLLLLVLETAALLCLAIYAAVFVLTKGPSPAMRDLFVMSMHETSALKFLPSLTLSEAELAEIESARDHEEYVPTDTSLITIKDPAASSEPGQDPEEDEWALKDEDGDGIILERVRGEGYNGYMMIVRDPSRVIMGSVPSSYGRQGYTVSQLVEHFDAVAGINGGGFLDPGGWGDGSEPDSMVVFNGEVYYASYGYGIYGCFVGFDDQHILHVGTPTREEIEQQHIQYGVCFGPALVINGVSTEPGRSSGVNPRTAIGQRANGEVLMLVIDGRQATSLGASYQDLADIMMSYGAMNACNLDGGSSSLLWYNGAYVNNKAHVVGIREVPTSFVVLKEGATVDG